MSPGRLKPVGKAKNDALPLDFGLLEIDEKAHGPAGGPQIVETLCGVLVGKAFGTFQFQHQRVFDKEIREILSHRMPLVDYGQRGFSGSPDASEAQLSKQGTLVNLLEKPGTQRVGDLEHSAQHLLAQRIQACVIGVHLRLSAASKVIGTDPQELYGRR